MRKQRSIKQVPHGDSVTRGDGWSNSLTGIGQASRDKSMAATFQLESISQESAEQLWDGDDIIARAIETVPDEMLREGFCIQVEGDKDLSEAMDARARELDLAGKALQALKYRRAYGGSGTILGVNDGGADLAQPLGSFYSLDYLNVFTPRELVPQAYYTDMAHYGEISKYWFNPLWMPPNAKTALQTIDASRVVRCEGQVVSKRRMLTTGKGWGESILTRCLRVISNFQQGWQGLGVLLQDFATPVLKIENLAQVLAGNQPGGQSLQARVAAIELTRSLARVVIIGKNEEYERKPIALNGLADSLDKLALRVAAALSMPVSLLMGQSPAGLNATGDSELRWFFSQVSAAQERELRPWLRPIIEAMFLDKTHGGPGKVPENWDIKFNPLWALTDKEDAELRYLTAQTDQIYLTTGVLIPETVAEQRFGGDDYSRETHVEMADWKKLAEEAAEQVPDETAPTGRDSNELLPGAKADAPSGKGAS